MSVFTPLSDDEIAHFLKNYDVGEFQKAIPTSEGIDNTNYIVVTSRDRYVLTLYEGRIAEDLIPQYLNFMLFLTRQDIPSAEPILTRDGDITGRIRGKPAALQSFLEGEDVREPTVTTCFEIAALLARMQLAARDYPLGIENLVGYHEWVRRINKSFPAAENMFPGLRRFLDEELKFLKDNWPQDLPHGPVHVDLFVNNVKEQNGHVTGIFDFYYSCDELWAYDFAITFNDWAFDQGGGPYNPEKGRALWEGYNSIREMTAAEVDALPTLARGAALRIMATRLDDWIHVEAGENIQKKDPQEYIDRIKFHQNHNVFEDLAG